MNRKVSNLFTYKFKRVHFMTNIIIPDRENFDSILMSFPLKFLSFSKICYLQTAVFSLNEQV